MKPLPSALPTAGLQQKFDEQIMSSVITCQHGQIPDTVGLHTYGFGERAFFKENEKYKIWLKVNISVDWKKKV